MKTLVVFIALLLSITGYAQTVRINGTVTDATNGDPLPGVSIVVKGTTTGVITDVDGKYSIECPSNASVLVVSYVGYLSQEITVGSQTIIDVKLEADIQKLEEVVVVGYGIRSSSRIQGRRTKRSIPTSQYYNPSNESYAKLNENGFRNPFANPLSTFYIDVDKAAYSNVRRFINNGQTPPADAVRIEEMINYFDYNYPQPTDKHPFSINTELADCPWQEGHKLIQIGVQGKKIDSKDLPASNLVFLIDVSGSMSDANKLPLLKEAFALLVKNLRDIDRVAIVVYAGAAGCVLPSTSGAEKETILEAINNLQSGGSTAGGEGIALAYQIAHENYADGGNNRVILATDGDFNVGPSSENEMEELITQEKESGVFLTCLGFGMGNYKDSMLEMLADKGNGNYAYIDNIQEANKTLVSEFSGTLYTIAKDVKIQVEFNPAFVQAYRLIGYENRLLNEEDFKDDTKDAGELGAGHTVTALYEIIPVGVESKFLKDVNSLKYQKTSETNSIPASTEWATVKMRYKKPLGFKSIELHKTIGNTDTNISDASENLKFVSAVAMFGMLLRNSEFKGSSSLDKIIDLAEDARTNDKEGYKAEFVRLVKSSLTLASLE